jgi:hypothetical protein
METMESLATGSRRSTIIAALMTASNLGSRITGYGFVVFTVGSLAWLALGSPPASRRCCGPTSSSPRSTCSASGAGSGGRRRSRRAARRRRSKRRTPGENPVPRLAADQAPSWSGQGAPSSALRRRDGSAAAAGARYLVVAEGGVAGVGETLRRVDWSDARGRRRPAVTK